jgi:hypothetical protein
MLLHAQSCDSKEVNKFLSNLNFCLIPTISFLLVCVVQTTKFSINKILNQLSSDRFGIGSVFHFLDPN